MIDLTKTLLKGIFIMKLKIMTFNIRFDNPDDGVNCFNGRKEYIKKFLDREKPDIIGFQEVLPHVRAWLNENLTDYVVIGMGRGKNYDDESSTIAYRKDIFDLVSFEQFMLSDSPDVQGSRYTLDQSGCPRIAAIATLVVREEGKVFSFCNTHLDHIGKLARYSGMTLILSKLMGAHKPPFIITGDLNATPDEEAIKLLKSHKEIKELTAGIPDDFATFHNYGKIKDNYKIDYIFTTLDEVKGSLKVYDEQYGDIYLTDHFPISAEAEI